MSTFLTTVALVVVGAWVLVAGGVILALCKAAAIEPPQPGTTEAQIEWIRAAAKVSQRRSA